MTEQNLNLSYLDTFANNNNKGLIIWDQWYRIIHYNNLASEIFGILDNNALNAPEIDNKFVFYSDKRTKSSLTKIIEWCINNNASDFKITIKPNTSNSERCIIINSSVIEDNEKQTPPTVLWMISESIEGSPKSSVKLKEELFDNNLWHSIMESFGYGFWDYDFKSEHVYFSEQLIKMTGYSSNDVEQNFRSWEKLIHPDDYPLFKQRLQEHISEKTDGYNSEHRIACSDGSYKWVIDQGKVIEQDEDGNPIKMVASLTDITTQKHFQESLNNSLIKQQELNELKTRFVSMASHEFRTPLSTILLSIETLEAYWERMSQDSINQKMSKIKNNIIFLKNIIEKVLNLTHVESGRIKLKPQTTDIVKMLDLIITEYYEFKNIKHKIVLKSELKNTFLYIDKQIFEQAIKNLISNSIKYSENGKSISIELTETYSDVHIAVVDSGMGIPEDDLRKLFTPFFRAKNVVNIRGTGLGLSLTREFIHLHNGQIKVSSKLNEGTTFTIVLPKDIQNKTEQEMKN